MNKQLARLTELARKNTLNTQTKAENDALTARIQEKRTWSRVKTELPDVAEFLTVMGGAFGKLAKVEVTNRETGEIFKLR
jgi:3-polyprenyl-4-hydroxybenzoate decarboxylase